MSDWDKTVKLINSQGYKPKTSMKTLVANICLHYDGLSEGEEYLSNIPFDEYLDQLKDGEHGELSDYDYE